MNRRNFIRLLGSSALAWPLAARAQQPERMPRIGVLMPDAENDPETSRRATALRQGLLQLGWTEGRNIRIEHRWPMSDTDLMRKFAKELVDLQPDLILTDTTPITTAVLEQTRTIPIVFVQVGDPVGSGFVTSFPRLGVDHRIISMSLRASVTRCSPPSRCRRIPTRSRGFMSSKIAR